MTSTFDLVICFAESTNHKCQWPQVLLPVWAPFFMRQRRQRGQISFRAHTLGPGPERVRRTREDNEDRGGSGRTREDWGGWQGPGRTEEDWGRTGEDRGGPSRTEKDWRRTEEN